MPIKLTSSLRIITFLPPKDVESVLAAVIEVDPLGYGAYTQVSWRSTSGIERFMPEEGSNPTVGEEHELSDLLSIRLEFCLTCPSDEHLQAVLKALIMTHPWEEPVVLVHSVQEARLVD